MLRNSGENQSYFELTKKTLHRRQNRKPEKDLQKGLFYVVEGS